MDKSHNIWSTTPYCNANFSFLCQEIKQESLVIGKKDDKQGIANR